MHILFYRRDGSPEMSPQYTSPGRSHFAQNELDYNFAHGLREGEVVNFHVGYGIFRDYVVEAVDDKTALLRSS